jgi:hypothetical protein
MMFRKLYWVTELVDDKGLSRVTGVYTSIPDLIRHGLRHDDRTGSLRLTLTKLDCSQGPLGTWSSPRYEGLAQRLEEFVLTDEFSKDQCSSLLEALAEKIKLTV